MALDGILFYKLKEEIKFLETGRINKIQEASDSEFLFTIRSQKENYKLLISLSANYPRFHLTNDDYSFPLDPKSFTMLLRKYFEGATINSIETAKTDRILIITASKYNEMGDFESKKLILEIMGRYSNLIIVENNIVKESLRHLGISEMRTVLPNSLYTFPDTKNKIDPFSISKDELYEILAKCENPKQCTSLILGLSLGVSERAFLESDPALALINFIYANEACLYKNNQKFDFTYFKYAQESTIYPSFSTLLDEFYKSLSKDERVKAKTNNILSFINKQLSRNKSKKTKLLLELEDTDKAQSYRLYGELLIANSHIKAHQNSIELLNYYTNENIEIKLDPRYDLMGNSKLYFKKYQKAKNAISHINEQLKIIDEEIEYFSLLLEQVKLGSLDDILGIQQELIENHYLLPPAKHERIKKTNILTYILPSGALLYVGKNNIQNEMVTHKLSSPTDLWFHVKDAPGSHVLLKKESDYTEDDIRLSSCVAAYYSTFKLSSSVPVNYTKVKNIKKIPGKKSCFVSIKNESTIYIDPDINLINTLKIKKQ